MDPNIHMKNKIIHKLEPPRNTKHLRDYYKSLSYLNMHLGGGGFHLIITHKITPGVGRGGSCLLMCKVVLLRQDSSI
jgi:hypothetical protein